MSSQDNDEKTEEDAIIIDERPLDSTCCMQKVLYEQADFCNEKPLLQIVIEGAGHKCYFLPKFHCELNPIEMYYGWVEYHRSLFLNVSEFLITLTKVFDVSQMALSRWPRP